MLSGADAEVTAQVLAVAVGVRVHGAGDRVSGNERAAILAVVEDAGHVQADFRDESFLEPADVEVVACVERDALFVGTLQFQLHVTSVADHGHVTAVILAAITRVSSPTRRRNEPVAQIRVHDRVDTRTIQYPSRRYISTNHHHR